MNANKTETLLAFVDEIGDRGHSGKSSEYFAMAAVIFPASEQQKVKDCIANIKKNMASLLKRLCIGENIAVCTRLENILRRNCRSWKG